MSRGWWWWALGIRCAMFEAWYLDGVVQVGGWGVKCLDAGSAFVISIHVTKIVLDLLLSMYCQQ